MSAEFLLKTAAVLEEAAKVLDAHEAEVQAATKLAHETAVKDLAEKYAQATGEELPPDVAAKLAASDSSVLGAVKQVFTKTAGTVESLGRSSETNVDRRPTTKKEAAESAWQKFGSFINS